MNSENSPEPIDRLITLNKMELVMGVLIAIMTIANGVGSWYVLPYRMTSAEANVNALSIRLDAHIKDGDRKDEMLIRIDERLSRLQEELTKLRAQLDKKP